MVGYTQLFTSSIADLRSSGYRSRSGFLAMLWNSLQRCRAALRLQPHQLHIQGPKCVRHHMGVQTHSLWRPDLSARFESECCTGPWDQIQPWDQEQLRAAALGGSHYDGWKAWSFLSEIMYHYSLHAKPGETSAAWLQLWCIEGIQSMTCSRTHTTAGTAVSPSKVQNKLIRASNFTCWTSSWSHCSHYWQWFSPSCPTEWAPCTCLQCASKTFFNVLMF